MGKRKSTQTQSDDKPKRGRKSTKQSNDDSSDEVSKKIIPIKFATTKKNQNALKFLSLICIMKLAHTHK